jgi:soluble cytochrome b562
MAEQILLGFEVPTGNPVYMRLHHTVVTGMTQLSGKTTTLEAIINRSGERAIAFKTKRGESGFNSYHEIPPFFVERADWRYVQSILEATMRERMRFERSWIIKASKGAKTLREVYNNVAELKKKARQDSLSESVYTVLEEYLKIVIPQIDKISFTTDLRPQDGINVMDLTAMSVEMRSLVIRSVMEHVIENLDHVIIVVPEAWEYLPQGRSTPVKWFAETFIRKGASIGNYLFVDSQDVAGIDKAPLRQCDNWIMGRQREIHEIDRLRDTIGKKFASEEEIRQLPLGTFFASIGDDLKKVYVLPVGIDEGIGVRVAKGELSPEAVKELLKLRVREENDEMYRELYEKEKLARDDIEKKFRETNESLETALKKLNGQEGIKKCLSDAEAALEKALKQNREYEEKFKDFERQVFELKNKLDGTEKAGEAAAKLKEALTELLEISPDAVATKPDTAIRLNLKSEEVTVQVTPIERVLEVDASKGFPGKILQVMLTDLNDQEWVTTVDISKALGERGWDRSKDSVRLDFLRMEKDGLVVKEGTKYRLPKKVQFKTGVETKIEAS